MRTEQGWDCLTCGWTTKYKTRLYEHVESKHVSTAGYNCPHCQQFCSSINALKTHKSRAHKNIIK